MSLADRVQESGTQRDNKTEYIRALYQRTLRLIKLNMDRGSSETVTRVNQLYPVDRLGPQTDACIKKLETRNS